MSEPESSSTTTSVSQEKNSSPPPASDPLTFLSQICGRLKTLKRTGWVRSNVPLPESDSDHMHRCAMCTLLLSQPLTSEDEKQYDGDQSKFHPHKKVNQTKLLKMALTHDLCEALAGDITPFCSKELVMSKHDKEKQSMKQIQDIIGDSLGKELYELWHEYEEQETVEAIYCKDIDKFEMVMQAFEYEQMHLKQKNNDTNQQENVHEENKEPLQETKKEITLEKNSKKRKLNTHNKSNQEKVIEEPLRTFFITTNSTMKTPLFRKLDLELRQRREAWLKENGWDVTEDERQKPVVSKQ